MEKFLGFLIVFVLLICILVILVLLTKAMIAQATENIADLILPFLF